jgi:hypothetical protein
VLDAALAANRDADLLRHEVSPLQGRFLELLVRMSGARNVLEIGTLGGYSTIWQLHRVSHERQAEIEIRSRGELLPEAAEAVALFESARLQAEDRGRARVEIGEDAIAVEVELPHLKRAGTKATGTGGSSRIQPRAAMTSLLSFARRPSARDQVMW